MILDGSCLCGAHAWRIEAGGGPQLALICHCSRCRRASGAINLPLAVFSEGFGWRCRGEAAGVTRPFCVRCGSLLPFAAGERGMAVPAGSLEGGLAMDHAEHTFVASALRWEVIADRRPRHAAYPEDWQLEGLPDEPAAPRLAGLCGGRCSCGAVVFEFDLPALLMGHCHCSRCRRSRGAAHATNLFVERAGFRWISGERWLRRFDLPGAARFGTCFCRRCGALVPRPGAERVNIPVGCLDGDPGIRPSFHIYTRYRASWFGIEDGLPQYDESRG